MSLTVFLLLLFSTAGASAATSGFLLGSDYGEWAAPSVTQIATDSAGAIYLLTAFPRTSNTASIVTKLSADGKTIVWQNRLGFQVTAMVVDPNGGVYVLPVNPAGSNPVSVARLNPAGSGVAWTLPTGLSPAGLLALAADSSGRVYVAGPDASAPEGKLIRINAAGTGIDYTATVTGTPTSVAVDATGAAFVAGFGGEGIFLARFTPEGNAGFFSSVAEQEAAPAVALDTNGEELVYASGKLQRYNSTGALTLSKSFQGWDFNTQALLLDSAGNAYIAGSAVPMYPVRNSLAPCGSDMLSVISHDGTILQTTYIPGAGNIPGGPLVAMGENSSVLVVDSADPGFTPTRSGPFGAGAQFLLRLSPNPNATIVPLACMGNAASYVVGGVAPGTILTLFGNALGPEKGVQAQASFQSPFPTLGQNMEVTFDGIPAPLLWVQDAQINVIAPWSLTEGSTTRVCVSSLGVTSNCLTEQVAQVSPGIFTVDGFKAAALNEDGTVNSAVNPAAQGSIVSVFATGLGSISPAQVDGSLVGLPLPGNELPAEVVTPSLSSPFFSGSATRIPLTVTYAGPAPYLVAGASQINFKVQSGVLYIKLGSAESQPFTVWIAGQP